jgi:hypothetical protein
MTQKLLAVIHQSSIKAFTCLAGAPLWWGLALEPHLNIHRVLELEWSWRIMESLLVTVITGM